MAATTIAQQHETWRPRDEPAINGLRAVAILAVLASHAGVPHLKAGDQGVTTFFAISGFLITGLLLAEFQRDSDIRLGAFYRRRFARLLPAFALSMIVTAIVVTVLGYGPGDFWVGLLGSAAYISNNVTAFGGIDPGSVNDLYFRHTWTLSLEEQFYAFWPITLVALLPRLTGWKWLTIIAVALTVGPMLWRIYLNHGGADYWRLKHATDTRVDAIMIGCLIALAFAHVSRLRPIAAPLGWIGALILLAVMVTAKTPAALDPDGYTTATIASAALIVSVVLARGTVLARGLGGRAMVYVGKRSYSLYLWNVLCLQLFIEAFDAKPADTPWGVIWIAGTFLVAEASYSFVEAPLRARWRTKRPLVAEPATQAA